MEMSKCFAAWAKNAKRIERLRRKQEEIQADLLKVLVSQALSNRQRVLLERVVSQAIELAGRGVIDLGGIVKNPGDPRNAGDAVAVLYEDLGGIGLFPDSDTTATEARARR